MGKYTFIAISMLFSVVPAVAQQTKVDEQSVQDALEMMRGGDIKGGITLLEDLAFKGNALAYYHLAETRRIGVGSDKNIPVATMFYRLSSQLGNPDAALKLANILFFEGEGTDAEIAEAISLWQSESIKGNTEALYMMGMIYWNGEAGFQRDPIRGYGLVWRASKDGYHEADQSLGTMSVLLERKAKDVGQRYAERLTELGFDDKPLAPHLLPIVDSKDSVKKRADTSVSAAEIIAREAQPSQAIQEGVTIDDNDELQDVTAGKAANTIPLAPEDWDTVWHLEVGFAMSELDVKRLQTVVLSTMAHEIGTLQSAVIESPNRPGLYRLVFGPVPSLQTAVTKCVALKRAGHDCFAKAPQEKTAGE